MKKIKVKICDPNLGNKFSYGTFFLNILKKYYEVELTEKPDYVIFNESTHEYLKYDGIRILFTGENITPNFNLCDYAIGFDYLTFEDRFYRMPLYLIALFYSEKEIALAKSLLEDPGTNEGLDFTKHKPFTKEDLIKKSAFCSFVYSNYLAGGQREEMFNKLSKYKRVDSGGRYLNNIGGPVKNKLAFENEHKFSIAFENSSRSGYTTEKLVNALIARTIPIYWGDPKVYEEFNQNRFINCHAYKNFDEVVERVKEIDQNDELYLSIINQPISASGHSFQDVQTGLEKFLRNIFDQPLVEAKRRTINSARGVFLEEGEKVVAKHFKKKYFLKKILAFLYKPLKKAAFFEKLKQKIFLNKIHKNQ